MEPDKALLANPLVWFFVGFAAAALVVYRNWERVKEVLQSIGSALSDFFSQISFLRPVVDGIKKAFTAMNGEGKLLTDIILGIVAVVGITVGVFLAWGKAMAVVKAVQAALSISTIKDTGTRIANTIATTANTVARVGVYCGHVGTDCGTVAIQHIQYSIYCNNDCQHCRYRR